MTEKQTRKMQQPQISLAIKESQKRAFLLLSGGNNVAEHFYNFMLSSFREELSDKLVRVCFSMAGEIIDSIASRK